MNILTGKFFNSDDERGIQGQVLGEVQSGFYLVQLYSWLDGGTSSQKIVTVNDMVDWDFYSTLENMRDHYARVIKVRRDNAITMALALRKQ